jgi:hypothetical protein
MSETYKVVINVQFGGFHLSDQAKAWLFARIDPRQWLIKKGFVVKPEETNEELMNRIIWDFSSTENRTDPLLIACVEALGENAGLQGISTLHVHEWDRSFGREYIISEYDGNEHVEHPWTSYYNSVSFEDQP